MKVWDESAAVAVVGLAAFELWKAWNTSAPTLAEVREAKFSNINVRQRLVDSDVTVGSLALIIGVALAVMTRDATALVLMLVIFASLSFFHHWVLDAEPR